MVSPRGANFIPFSNTRVPPGTILFLIWLYQGFHPLDYAQVRWTQHLISYSNEEPPPDFDTKVLTETFSGH